MSLLGDSTYVGEHVFNRCDAKTRIEKPQTEWIVVNVTPIIDLGTFEKVQRIRASHEPARKPGKTVSSPLLLAGLVRCGYCGAAMTLETGKGGEYRYYNCRRFLREGKSVCHGQRVPCADFEKAVLEHLAEVVFSEKRVKTIIQDVLRAHVDMHKSMSTVAQRLKRQIDEVDLKLKRQIEAIESGAVDLKLVGERIQELREQREALAQELSEKQAPKPIPTAIHSSDNIREIQSSLKQLFFVPGSTVARRYTGHLVNEIVVKGTDVQIRGNTTAFLSTLAQKNNVRTGNLPVLTLGHDWLPDSDSNQGPSG